MGALSYGREKSTPTNTPEAHQKMIDAGIVHRGPYAGHKIASLTSDQLREIKGTPRPGRRTQGTRAALFAAIDEELDRRSRGESIEPSEGPQKPFPKYRYGVVPWGKNRGRLIASLKDKELAGCHSVALQLGPPEYAEDLKAEIKRRRVIRQQLKRSKSPHCRQAAGSSN